MHGGSKSKSIAFLYLGILSIIVIYAGLILGIIGFVMARKVMEEIDNQSNNSNSLAVSGRILSTVDICIQSLLFILTILGFAVYYVKSKGFGVNHSEPF
ncbi:DUF4190 domain-containing protein [Bacillus sp. FSL K6-3431]|uniref:DUF4190 domain-containing protein n=1 Tax=Bacillus sp. FSL K6-3431 TaxID=2921500 RepID=UPI0030FD1AFA